MSDFRRDFESEDDRQRRLSAAFDEPITVETDVGKLLEQPDIVIKPGSYYARQAYKAGREEEYIDRMRSRYGGEW